MASLPNKSFVFNYNAKNYVSSTRTIPNESGASMDRGMVWSGRTATVRNQITFDEDHLNIPVSAYSTYWFSSVAANPLNITASAPSMTLVVKWKRTKTTGSNIIANRDTNHYNWMARQGSSLSFHTANGNTSASQLAPCTEGTVITAVYRIDNQEIEIINLTTGEKNTPFTTNWQSGTQGFSFFAGNARSTYPNSEFMSGEFYWAYLSREVLTDAEIRQVVKFNEGGGISIDSTGTTIAQSGGTSTVNIEADTGWTVTSYPSWVTVSPSSGESGTTAITFTIKKNNFSSRTGVVVFTDDGGNEAEYTIEQGGTENQLPYNKIYRNNRRIN